MAKAIIPKEQLPEVDENLVNKLRFRVINRNRNLYSQWSVIGEVKRQRELVDFLTNATSYSATSTKTNNIDISWYTTNINQEYEVYVRYITKSLYVPTGATLYSYEPLSYLGRKNVNSISLSRMPLSDRLSIYTLSSYGLQAMVKLPEYPRVASTPIEVSEFRRKSNLLDYWLTRSVPFKAGDYININLNNFEDISSPVDNSIFAGIKRVYSVGSEGPNTFSVQSVGSDIPLRSAVDYGPTLKNTVEKINGQVQFITGDVIFT